MCYSGDNVIKSIENIDFSRPFSFGDFPIKYMTFTEYNIVVNYIEAPEKIFVENFFFPNYLRNLVLKDPQMFEPELGTLFLSLPSSDY